MVLLSFVLLICFVKQKTAYWMLISDWSSDVCSSDLRDARQSKIAEIGPTFETTHSRSCSPLGLGHLRIHLEQFFQPLGVIAESATDIDAFKHLVVATMGGAEVFGHLDRKSTRLNSRH